MSGSRCTFRIGSSSVMRASAELILSVSAFDFGKTATLKIGSGKWIGASLIGFSRVVSVSPVSVSASLATAPISPTSCCVGSCVLPRTTKSWPMRSSALWFAFQACESALSVPEKTRR